MIIQFKFSSLVSFLSAKDDTLKRFMGRFFCMYEKQYATRDRNMANEKKK